MLNKQSYETAEEFIDRTNKMQYLGEEIIHKILLAEILRWCEKLEKNQERIFNEIIKDKQ